MRRSRRRFLATEKALAEAKLTLPAVPERIADIHETLARLRERIAFTLAMPEPWFAFELAVIEIASNIIRHAYPPAAPDASFELTLTCFREQLRAHFTDAGQPFADPPLPLLDDLPEGGMGLFLAREALDTLEYQRTPEGINHWFLVKRLP